MTVFKPLCLALGLATAGLTLPLAHAEETPIEFTAQSGETVAAFQGHVEVPENRADPDSRLIRLSYVRFPATTDTPGNPIVYLAGGPGGSGSGTARAQRFPLFMQMRQHGDVIAFDQRGTGDSTPLPGCASSVLIPDTQPVTDAELASAYREAVEECGAFWREQGIALEGYTTRDSVADLSDLRAHLGASRIDLWGISYGSHLALAALNEMPNEIGRVVIASAEGLDQTVKFPARTDAYIARLQAAVDSQPAARAAYPDIAGLMRRVHARLEAEPLLLDIPQQDGTSAPYLLQRHNLQQFASGMISDPGWARIMLALYASLDAGDPQLAIALLQRFHTPGEPITLRAMPTAMDLASGISDARLAEVERQAQTSLLGAYLNFPMPQIRGAWDGFDLGEDFRTGPTGDTPVLLLTGTLDGRTYPQAQAEAVAGLSHVTQIIVRNAGHNLFMSSPAVHDAMHAFMRGETVTTSEIEVELPDFTELPF
ncbi:alpha/beta fold hydrolase [Maricaulis parjimensis]|uniref:alpha/beta fold hydrolase n=1 Tax=Maricaulis parjimensis TaxID=144023 RepID=UPI001939D561|nr:alpha/beta fold hydrolase [Maricaulis parjimensis]